MGQRQGGEKDNYPIPPSAASPHSHLLLGPFSCGVTLPVGASSRGITCVAGGISHAGSVFWRRNPPSSTEKGERLSVSYPSLSRTSHSLSLSRLNMRPLLGHLQSFHAHLTQFTLPSLDNFCNGPWSCASS